MQDKTKITNKSQEIITKKTTIIEHAIQFQQIIQKEKDFIENINFAHLKKELLLPYELFGVSE